MNAIFPGHIALEDGDAVDVSLTVEGAELRLATPAAPIGSWPLVSCRLDELGPGRYRLTVDDDFVDFSPADPDGFAAFLSGLSGRRGPERQGPPVDVSGAPPPHPSEEPVSPPVADLAAAVPPAFPDAGPLTVEEEPPGFDDGPAESGDGIDDEIARVVDVPEPTVADSAVEEARRPVRFPWRAVGIGAGALLVLVSLVVALGGSGAPEASPQPAPVALTEDAETGAREEPAEAVATPVAVDETTEGSVFVVPAATAVSSWNTVAAPIAPTLRIGVVPTSGAFAIPLTGEVTVAGGVAPDGTLDELTVAVDGTSGVPALGLQALGVAVAVVEPGLDGPARARVLASLGFDVAAPATDGLDAAVTREAATYRLVAAAGVVTLTITPS